MKKISALGYYGIYFEIGSKYYILVLMTPEERQLLIQTSRLVEENNKMLRKMHRAALWARIWHLLYWVIIIGISVGAYLYIQPYVEKLQGIYGGFKGDMDTVQSVTEQLGEVGKLLGR